MKLIDLLVKELPKRGGWPAFSSVCWGDPDGEIRFDNDTVRDFYPSPDFVNGDERACSIGNSSNGITRDQYESALAASEGWIEWGGGECPPVATGTVVDVRYRDGQELSALPANDIATSARDASRAFWRNDGAINDIIAYRLHKPDINSRTNDDRLEQDIGKLHHVTICVDGGVIGGAPFNSIENANDYASSLLNVDPAGESDLNECIGQNVDMPEWNGDGLPPVGERIEYACKEEDLGHPAILKGSWYGGTIIAYHDGCVWTSDNGIRHLDNTKFRPLRTEEEKALESAKHIIAELCRDSASNGHSADLIMEAIAAGKIPGVKLEDK